MPHCYNFLPYKIIDTNFSQIICYTHGVLALLLTLCFFFAAQWIYRQIQFFTSRCRLALTILMHLIFSYTEYHYLKCILNFLSCLAEGETYQTNSPLQIIESFLEALTNADKDGRIVVNKQGHS